MRPSDPRVRAQLAPARAPLTGVLTGSVLSAVLVICQAFAVAAFVVAAVGGHDEGRWALVVVAVIVARALAGLLTDACAALAAARVGTDMRRRVVAATLQGESAPASTGETALLVTRGVTAAEPYLTRYLPALVLAGVLPAMTVVAIATQDVMSAVIVLATLPLVPVFGALVGLATRDRAEEQWRSLSVLSAHFLDVVKGLPTLVAFRRARAQSATIRSVTEQYRMASARTLRLAFASSAVLEVVATLSVALVAVVVGVRLAAGGLDLRTALVVLLLAPEAYWPLRRVGAEFHAAAEGLATFERLADLTDRQVRREVDGSWGGDLVLDHVSVTHPGRQRPVLADVSARVPSCGLTAVVGASGSGKSTLLSAIMGLTPVASGAISIEGRAVGGAGWQSLVSWLPQRPSFVDGTVADNLRLGSPGAGDAELWDALRRVSLEQRVRDLPLGLETRVGEDGRTLSAGERARLALARALVAKRPWLLLDEPTAHLDEASEQIVAATLKDLARTSGVIVVAHRLALVAIADQVITLPDPPAVVDPTRATSAGRSRTPVRPVIAPPATRRPSFALSTALGAMASVSGVALTATAGWLIVKAAEHPPVLTMLVAIVGVRAFGLARPVLRYAERLRSHDEALRLLAERRVQVYDAVVPLTPGRLGRSRGDTLAAIVDDVDAVVDRRLRVLLPARTAAAVVVLVVGIATAVLPEAGLVIGLTSLVAGLAAYGVPQLGSRSTERRAVTHRARLSAVVVEAVQNARELVMWQAQRRVLDSVDSASVGLATSLVRSAVAAAIGRFLALLVLAGGIALTGIVAGDAVAAGTLSGPMLALLTMTPLALVEVLVPMADAGALSRRVAAAEERLADLEHTAPLVLDGPGCVTDPEAVVTLTNVSAGWDDEVFRDLSLTLPPGSRLGVVGPSGSGKSTLAALLLRFLDPTRGVVTLSGQVLPQLALDEVRGRIGLVDDEPHVFASTVGENVRLARPDATDADVLGVLQRAGLGSWVQDLPEGIETWVGDGHADLSGGERARLAVARSLLADQPVLVLDEPTAALDTATAEQLAVDVLDLAEGRTVVWITHGRVGLDRMTRVLELG